MQNDVPRNSTARTILQDPALVFRELQRRPQFDKIEHKPKKLPKIPEQLNPSTQHFWEHTTSSWRARFRSPYFNTVSVVDRVDESDDFGGRELSADVQDDDNVRSAEADQTARSHFSSQRPVLPLSREELEKRESKRLTTRMRRLLNETPPHRRHDVAADLQADSNVNDVDIIVEVPYYGAHDEPMDSKLVERLQIRKAEIMHMRREKNYIEARVQEDTVHLFDVPSLDTSRAVVPEERKYIPKYDPNKDYDPDYHRLERWTEINQGRYFWDFVDPYSSHDKTGARNRKEVVKRIRAELKAYDARQREKTLVEIHNSQLQKIQEDIEGAKRHQPDIIDVVVPFEFLPSIFPSEPPAYRRIVARDPTVTGHRLYDYGRDVERICRSPPLIVDFNRWTLNSLSYSQVTSSRTQEIMNYIKGQDALPDGVKSFEETYPNISKEQLEKLQKQREEQEALLKKTQAISGGRPGAAPTAEDRAPIRKVAGGRYTLR